MEKAGSNGGEGGVSPIPGKAPQINDPNPQSRMVGGRWLSLSDDDDESVESHVYCDFCSALVDIVRYDHIGAEIDPGWLYGDYDRCIECNKVACRHCMKRECVWNGCRGTRFEDGKRVECESSGGEMWCWDCSQDLDGIERCSVCAEKVICDVCAENEDAWVRCAWCGTGHIRDLRIRGVSCVMSDDEMRQLRIPKETGFHLVCGQCADVESPEFTFECDCPRTLPRRRRVPKRPRAR